MQHVSAYTVVKVIPQVNGKWPFSTIWGSLRLNVHGLRTLVYFLTPVNSARVHGCLKMHRVHWPSWQPSTRVHFWHPLTRADLTGVKKYTRVHGRVLGRWTRAVNSGSGNWPLILEPIDLKFGVTDYVRHAKKWWVRWGYEWSCHGILENMSLALRLL